MAFDNGPFNEDTFMEEYFRDLRDLYNIKVVIETGTYHGKTTEWLCRNFDQVATIEVNDEFYAIAMSRFLNAGLKNVTAIKGSSADCLTRVLEGFVAVGPYSIKRNFHGNVLIFLDAHWYENPVLKELEAIRNSGIKPVLAIHDFKNPEDETMGFDVYPDQGIVYEYSWVKSLVEEIYGHDPILFYNKQAAGARRGCLFVVPQIPNQVS